MCAEPAGAAARRARSRADRHPQRVLRGGRVPRPPGLVADTSVDPHWQARREAIRAAGMRSAWSVPIRGGSGRIVGALGIYRPEAGQPERTTLELLADSARLAGIAIERRRSEEALRGSEAKFRGLFESVMEGVYQSLPDGRLLSVNPALVKMLGYGSAEELYALPSAAMLYWSPSDRAAFVRQVELAGEIRNAEFELRRRDGQQIVVLESARAVRDAEGRVVSYEGTIADITERKRAEQAIFREKERAQVTLQSIGDAVITADAAGRIEYMNPVAEQLTGWRLDEVQGRAIGEVLRLVNDATREPLENPLLRALASGNVVGPTDQSALVDRAGHETAIQDSAAPIRDRGGGVVGAVVVFHDVTRERRLRRALAYQATHDALTGLINRREFDNRLHAALQAARRGEGSHAVLYVDLDQFKLVNDTCGHSAGDRLIREITTLLQGRLRASDVIARLGGDEFGVLLDRCTLEQAGGIAETVRQAVRDYRFVWGGTTISVGASIGVVEISRESESVAAIMSAADVACYSAKDQGRNRIQLYEDERGRDRHREMKWIAQVARAAEERRFDLVSQPIRALRPGLEQQFFELMVRMRDEHGNLIQPGDFIPAAERYNVMPTVDRWVVEEAVRVLRALPAGLERPLLAVNVSGNSLSDQSFLDSVLALVDEPVLARSLCFEITETAAVSSLDQAAYFMRELQGRGCRFSLDDFGSGLSSFSYLRNLPVDFLKIDGQFVRNVATDAVDRSMVQAIVQVGRTLGIATVAEKVESGAVLDALAALGVDYAQGFHLARPAPIAGLEAMLCGAPAAAAP
ncbi:MAG: EAL domain-containing protein [Steroidobacteraceae bacterium]